ncbi:copper amine oxidase N-terminal domain-containing protein [Bacillus sp. FJAT-28004]|uniref:copper amine oxidase N-terminal domain-containing protein n=1 Tax=Bacillus sp. FJAT-28004 TaxID=1679165 RepID=UPI0006B692EF|nr:copper amine oxidase N-terminal domain-containing protein [Bacillus sp. FJAT-28004]
MKKLIASCAVIGMICFSSSALAAENISIKVKNKQVQTDSAPVIVQGRVLVPLRTVSESLGASVEWNQQQKTAIVSKWSKKASLTVGKKTAWIENSAASELSGGVSLDVTVRIINSRVYVPLRFISQQLDYKVDYKNNTVSIHSPYAGMYNENFFAQILSGDLSRSRSILSANTSAYGLRNYEHPPLKTIQPASSVAYLFPEGEALRFFLIENNETITFFEYKADFFVVTWQAHVEQVEGNAIEQLFADNLKDRTGPTPKIKKSFLYNYYEMYGNSVWRSGRIDVDGKYTETGYKKEDGDSFGTISSVLPNEVRNEFVTIPQSYSLAL